jgi:HAD superfamily hydrolase (TIGR01509 family)
LLKAVLFDFDGVLIDSEKAVFLAVKDFLESQGISGVTQEDLKTFTGAGEDFYFDSIIQRWNLNESKEKIVKIILENFIKKLAELDFFPGVIQFCKVLKSNGVKLAIVTSASKSLTDKKINKMGLDISLFDLLVYGENVKNNKPAPDIYLHAGKLLNIDMADCLIIEDAINGVIAGKKSGAKVMGFCSSVAESELIASGADFVCSAYQNIEKMQEFKAIADIVDLPEL